MEYSEPRILKDTKNILYQNFVEKYYKTDAGCHNFLADQNLRISINFDDVETIIFRKVMQRLMFAPELFLHTLVIVNKDI